MNAILAIATTELKRFLADKGNIFFVFIFPLALVFVLGSQFGSSGPVSSVAVSQGDSELRTALVAELEGAAIDVRDADEDGVRSQVANGSAVAGIVIDEADEQAYLDGANLDLELISSSGAEAPVVTQVIRDAASSAMVEVGQRAALEEAGFSGPEVEEALAQAASDVPPAELVTVDTSRIAREFAGADGFSVGAGSQVLLFTFLTALTGAVTLIQGRRDGVIRRTMAAPVTSAQTMMGQVLGRLVIALFQASYIVLATWLLFGVDWGNLLAVGAVLLMFGLVAAGAAMVVGVLLDSEGAATGLSVGLGLVLAALGGTMMPLELFPDTLRTVAHVTPHTWAYEALAQIQRQGAGVLDVLPELGALAGMAVLTVALGSWLLRRSLERAM